MEASPVSLATSTPSFSEFDPTIIPYQAQAIDDLYGAYDWGLGVHEILLSGSVGSAKSLLMAHLGIRHLLEWPRARACVGRQAMPDLRDTIYMKILEHLEGTVKEDGSLVREGKDFGFRDSNCSVWFSNGSEIVSRSWADKKWKKLGSLEFSIALIEELTENDATYWPFYQYIRMRVGRLPHVPVNWIMCATNPDSPTHPAYDYFQIGRRQAAAALHGGDEFTWPAPARAGLNPTRHVHFSRTHDNPFLPKWYIEGLEGDLDPKMVRRMVYGEWIEIAAEVVYYAYADANWRPEVDYEPDPLRDIAVCFDFNIGQGKPMSACLSQSRRSPDGLEFHFYDEAVVEGADTEDLMEEMAGRGLFEVPTTYVIYGDATGGARTTKSKLTDYEIIEGFLRNYRTRDGRKVDFRLDVPRANPPVRTRHNRVNAYCRNGLGKRRLFVYRRCKTLNKGFRLTALKSGGQYVEDDSVPWQHVTTAAGYYICRVHDTRTTSTVRQGSIR